MGRMGDSTNLSTVFASLTGGVQQAQEGVQEAKDYATLYAVLSLGLMAVTAFSVLSLALRKGNRQ